MTLKREYKKLRRSQQEEYQFALDEYQIQLKEMYRQRSVSVQLLDELQAEMNATSQDVQTECRALLSMPAEYGWNSTVSLVSFFKEKNLCCLRQSQNSNGVSNFRMRVKDQIHC